MPNHRYELVSADHRRQTVSQLGEAELIEVELIHSTNSERCSRRVTLTYKLDWDALFLGEPKGEGKSGATSIEPQGGDSRKQGSPLLALP